MGILLMGMGVILIALSKMVIYVLEEVLQDQTPAKKSVVMEKITTDTDVMTATSSQSTVVMNSVQLNLATIAHQATTHSTTSV